MKSKPQTLADKEAEFLEESAGRTTTPGNSELEKLRTAIAEAAYYRAEKRGFAPGFETTDWLEAEREIDARRSTAPSIRPPVSAGQA